MKVYNYNHLFYFYVTAKLDGVTVAAKHLNTSQSSLSTQIKTLESALDRDLFRKSGRKMELTEAGKEMFSYCRRAFDVFDEMFDQLAQKSSSMGVRVTVGVSVNIERPFITDALARVSKQYQKGHQPLLNLISLPSKQLLQLLKIGEIDLLLTSSSGVDASLTTVGEFNFPVGAFVSKDLFQGKMSEAPESVFRRQELPFVLPSKMTSLRSEIDGYFVRKKVKPVCVFESNIMSSVIRAACDQMGITILPQVYVIRELRSEKLVSLSTKPLWKHRIALFTARQGLDEGRRVFAERLIKYLNESAEQSMFLK